MRILVACQYLFGKMFCVCYDNPTYQTIFEGDSHKRLMIRSALICENARITTSYATRMLEAHRSVPRVGLIPTTRLYSQMPRWKKLLSRRLRSYLRQP